MQMPSKQSGNQSSPRKIGERRKPKEKEEEWEARKWGKQKEAISNEREEDEFIK
jgi:hypothetical protein